MIEVSESNPQQPKEVNLCPKCGEERVWRKSNLLKNGVQRYGWRCNPCNTRKEAEKRAADPEGSSAKSKAYYYANLEKIRAKNRGRYGRNKAHFAAYQKMAKQRRIERGCEWTLTESGRLSQRLSVAKTRAIRRGVYIDITLNDARQINSQLKHCYYCGSTNRLTFDHVASLHIGGPHIAGNIVIACLSCNSRKRIGTPAQWAAKSNMHIYPMEERFYYSQWPRITAPSTLPPLP